MPVLWRRKMAIKVSSSSRPQEDVPMAGGSVDGSTIPCTRLTNKETVERVISDHVPSQKVKGTILTPLVAGCNQTFETVLNAGYEFLKP